MGPSYSGILLTKLAGKQKQHLGRVGTSERLSFALEELQCTKSSLMFYIDVTFYDNKIGRVELVKSGI